MAIASTLNLRIDIDGVEEELITLGHRVYDGRRTRDDGTRFCTTCETHKPATEFSVSTRRLPLYQWRDDRRLDPAQEPPPRRVTRDQCDDCVEQSTPSGLRRAYIRTYKQHQPCADCGQRYASYIMEFDHTRGEKRFELSNPPAKCLLDEIQQEIEKCDVVCANCHRHRTVTRRMTRKQQRAVTP